jgi:penicillin-binding protein 2
MTSLGASRVAEGRLERRIVFVSLIVLAVWIVLVARLFYLQVVQGDRFRISAERNSIRTHRIEPPRGMILDRSGGILVDSRPAFEVLLVPHETPDTVRTVHHLSRLADFDPEPVRERLGTVRGRARFQPQRVAYDVSRDILARVEARLWALPGVHTRVAPIRSYIYETSAAHVLGTLGEISAGQLEQRHYAGYRRGDVIGRSGVEALFDRELRGRAGGRHLLVDAHGRELEELGAVAPQPASNLVLTLDRRLQLVAEAGLDETGHGGAVVALQPRTGEVLVLVSRPSFSPNEFARGIDPTAWKALLDDPRKPLQNRALQGVYPPGSTYKVVTALAGLEEGLIQPSTTVDCYGSTRLGRRRYRCWKRGGHGRVQLHRALVESCDVFFYQVGHQVGVDKLAYYARALGLGRPTGIELSPEAGGLVPTKAWKQRRFGERWVDGETLSIAIGQGFNLWTPIQLASVYASIANGGIRMRPHVFKRLETPEGEQVQAEEIEQLGVVPISSSSLDLVRAALRGVVHDPHGTGYAMRRLAGGVEAAGKTGTAQVVAQSADDTRDDDEIPEHHRDHAWFVTWVPADDPQLVVAVLVEHGGHGSSAAAPIARRVVDKWLEARLEGAENDGGY